MTLDWKDIAERVVALGAPVLGAALGGPLGGAAGQILADALGAPATPANVERAIVQQSAGQTASPDAIARAESEWIAALAAVGRAQVSEVAQTQRAEMVADNWLQRVWRPVYALELSLFECPAFAFTLLRALWNGHGPGIEGFASLSGLLMAYFAARFGVLGVYVTARSREKQACATGQNVPGVLADLVKLLRKR